MASITQAQLSADMNHALEDFGVTLTVVLPSGYTGTTFSATRASITQGFILETNGRDVQIDSAFYLNLVSLSPVPEKGWIVAAQACALDMFIPRLVRRKQFFKSYEFGAGCTKQVLLVWRRLPFDH